MFEGLKGPGEAQSKDGSSLRIGIVHARWNTTLIEPLLTGAISRLKASGVDPSNIIVQSVPGSWELPIAVQRLYSASQIQASTSSGASGDLLGSATDLPSLVVQGSGSGTETGSKGDGSLKASNTGSKKSEGPFDAIIAIGVLIKGETVHFEHIAEVTSRGLMRVQLDFGVPLIFGLLTVLNEEQGRKRAGLTEDGHNHGEDWGDAAVEMAIKRKQWNEGVIVSERSV
ncbi:hypothetical protein TWF106_001444 [Orbilia oligospora]|uniref:6,7-dimethyl-8-ribityllumazine synthase n=1 Tax=Orbilia oligospora TaxID=2813651 RepID=A0A6G1M8W0_ORBOL|nr:hypothetical protein TWF106_001444 [Orbilia oligospora]KAF3214421.1 hypothetical protein TWF679_004795 [Orbilia oligospora]KAF3230572.1 hypothetical protein TWF191_009487 [Orbilia oligospora]KAF3249060.1 hypothetical protein TWF192_006008 [Orbilia oligospora]